MTKASWIILGAVSAAVLAPFASAELVGLRVFREEPGGPGQPPLGPERWIYRVYAEFTESDDLVTGWGTGIEEYGFGGIWNITEDGLPGSGFTNIPDSSFSNSAPLFWGTFADWDTYMTIGLLYEVEGPGNIDYTNVSVGTQLFIGNGTTSWTDGGVYLGPNFSQGTGAYRVTGNDTDTRVLLMQLVVNAGEHVQGSIGVGWVDPSLNLTFSANLPFNSIPGPGTLALFLMTVNHRTRRRSF